MEALVKQFQFEGEVIAVGPTGNGHINDTFLVTTTVRKYILQRINTNIFKEPVPLMESIMKVCAHLHQKIEAVGGDTERGVLTVVPTVNGESILQDEAGDYWRGYIFIENTVSYDIVPNNEVFYNCAKKLGEFQRLLSDFDASTLFEVIPNFHNTKKRFETFQEVLAKDVCHRAADIQAEVDFVRAHEKDAASLVDLYEAGKLPLRVTHNDTKINNIMMDATTHEGVCVIDLDTVMPGLSAYDFGDAIRTGATSGAEDELDLSLVNFMPDRFEAFAKGFLEEVGESFNNEEIYSLLIGAKVITLETGIRFLTDYLDGDNYFKIHRPNHNLDRARTQFKLVQDMEAQWASLEQLVQQFMHA
ncbi:phosphotransferase enzyme family protein [Niameybacter sp.]|uniref:phosphotransferase enzyme family protein n=1 Tax=Niameybacter sp. TaxID=2033640 RepID=UPI002FC96D71